MGAAVAAVRMDVMLHVGLGAPRLCVRDGCSGSASADGCGSVDSADECGALGRAKGTWVAAQMKAVLYFDLRAEREREIDRERERERAVEWRGRAVLTAASIHATVTEWRLWKLGSLTARPR